MVEAGCLALVTGGGCHPVSASPGIPAWNMAVWVEYPEGAMKASEGHCQSVSGQH